MRKTLWLLTADFARPDIPLVLPTVAWMAEAAGAAFECYLECERKGDLFARTGSTVLGGRHHQQFNYLSAAFDVRHILLGEPAVFASSIAAFGSEVLARADDAVSLYRALLDAIGACGSGVPAAGRSDARRPSAALFGPVSEVPAGGAKIEIAPYLFPEIFCSRSLGFAASDAARAAGLMGELGVREARHAFLTEAEREAVARAFPSAEETDGVRDGDGYGSMTLRIAGRWKAQARGVAFGDPPAILSQIPAHCRCRRVAAYAPPRRLAAKDVRVSAYTEAASEIAEDVARLAEETGNRVLAGRQTCDGDLFEWSKRGVCMQIGDPNRPAFPVVETVRHPWACVPRDLWLDEPDDAALRRFADEGKVLATLLWHSGEVAHNEAMLNLFDLACHTGLKMGIGVHAARYETCPQLWELLQVSREKGGVRGLVEPVLHSGGMGIMAEVNCPPERLGEHCREALRRIRGLAGPNAAPRGYYAFMDANLADLSPGDPAVWSAVEAAGLRFAISSAVPGRNRILRETPGCVVLNQTCRTVCPASPFVRITTVQEIWTTGHAVHPGWLIAALDSPVIAFNPYIWREGSKFMEIAAHVQRGHGIVNVLPDTVARYARILREKGFVRADR